MRKKIIFPILLFILALGVSGCTKKEINNNYSSDQESEALIEQSVKEDNNSTTNLTNNSNNNMSQEILKEYSQAEFQTSEGNFTIEFFNDKMPITVGNFLTLADSGYFDGTKFHRVIENFMIQGGDPLTKDDSPESLWGTGGPGYAIEDEHVSSPELSNVVGTISMANSGPNSGGSQFFINVANNTFLDFDKEPLSSKHPVFGKVVSGMDVVEKISKVETGLGDRPTTPVVIKKVNLK